MTATEAERSFVIGSLVSARGRDWVVQPGSDQTMLVLRPLGGGDDDVSAVLLGHEAVVPATFARPQPDDLGDDRSARLLRDALRIGFRSTGGPFRCLAGIAVTPRPYQLVPLLLALRQETVRLLIADDVGVGKTIEAGLVAAELLAQGTAGGLAVLCPPSLATQWGDELATKFGLEPVVVLPGTVRALERGLTGDESIFTRHPVTVVSTDFIKSDRRRHEFLRTAPDLVVVDEAHGSVSDDAGHGGRGRTQRYRLLRDLADDASRHLVLVTATPHSGHEGAFRNLIGLLDPRLAGVDLGSEGGRRLLADHLVQRRRADIRTYLQQDTKFPSDRLVVERPYKLSPSHRSLFDDVLRYVRGEVRDTAGSKLEQRVRWWSALALLRSVASSPAAAAATLATRSASAGAETVAQADDVSRGEVLDLSEDEAIDNADAAPGAIGTSPPAGSAARSLRRLLARASALAEDPGADTKLGLLAREVQGLLREGYSPIVFCRFIPTAKYVTAALRTRLRNVPVDVVTGELAAEERSGRVAALAERAAQDPKVLVATDCLSEGVNLQDDFQAVVHYDLAWNPTRHEQREGRVDRFGQRRDVVRALLIYGEDTGIDGIVLDVLLRKHEAIRKDLGVSVAVPPQSDQVLSALLEGVLLRGREGDQPTLDLDVTPQAAALDEEWRSTAEAERRSRSRFAQSTVRPDDVHAALTAARSVLGEPADMATFARGALIELGGQVLRESDDGFAVDVSGTPVGVRDALRVPGGEVTFARDLPAPRGTAVLQRTDATVSRLARYVLDAALDARLPDDQRPARRCGVILTTSVTRLTTLLLLRIRSHLTLPARGGEQTHVTEEARVVAFTGPTTAPVWLTPPQVDELLAATPSGNVNRATATTTMGHVLDALGAVDPDLDRFTRNVADELREAHVTVRRAARGDRAGQLTIAGLRVEPQLPVDVLGVYVLRPAGTTR